MNNDYFIAKAVAVFIATTSYYTWGIPWLLSSSHTWMHIFALITLLIPALLVAILFVVQMYYSRRD